jgi:hypothetical protein
MSSRSSWMCIRIRIAIRQSFNMKIIPVAAPDIPSYRLHILSSRKPTQPTADLTLDITERFTDAASRAVTGALA